MQKWEYLEVQVVRDKVSYVQAVNGQQISYEKREEFYAYVHELGRQGWELVTVKDAWFYFKRPIE